MRSARARGTRIALASLVLTALSLAQGNPLASLSAARRAARGGDFECAVALYTDVLSVLPDDRDALKGRAQVLGWSTRYAEAEADYRRVLALDPVDVEARIGLGRTLLREDRFEESEKVLRDLLAFQPREPDARMVLGDLLLRTDRPFEALAEFDRAAAIDPADPRARLGRARALSACGLEGDACSVAAETAAALSRRIAQHPEDVEARLARAAALARTNRPEEALAEYEAALRLSPGNLEAELGRAALELRLGRLEDARDDIRSLLFAHPGSAEAHALEGLLLLRVGRAPDAGKSYASAADLDPWNADYRLGIAHSRSASADIDGAREAAGEALALDPWSHDVRDLVTRLDAIEVPGRFRLDTGLRFDRLNGAQEDWSQETAHLAWRARPDLTLGLGIDGYQRFGDDDVQVTADAGWRVDELWTLSSAFTYGPDAEVVARSAVDIEVARRVSASSTALLHWRHTTYAGDVRTDIVSPGLQFPCGPDESLLARYYFVDSSDTGQSHAGSLSLELFPEGNLRTRLGIAYGSEAFIATTASGAIQTSDVLTVFAGVQWRCSKRTRVSLAYDYEDHEASPDKRGLTFGFTVEF